MSGRESEAVAAFFPAIDRNLMRDLDRHLRSAQTMPEPAREVEPAEAPPSRPSAPPPDRPNVASIVEAVEQAAHSIAAMTQRIEELEAHVDTLEEANDHLTEQVRERDELCRAAEAELTQERDRTERAETLLAQQITRATKLENDLGAAHADLSRVTEAITAALGLPGDRRA